METHFLLVCCSCHVKQILVQMNLPQFNLSQTDQYLVYLLQKDGRVLLRILTLPVYKKDIKDRNVDCK